jgi:hypothetical protein
MSGSTWKIEMRDLASWLRPTRFSKVAHGQPFLYLFD